MPTLIPEDGTNVPNANTYGDRAGLQAFADDRGLAIGTDVDDLDRSLIVAFDFIQSLEPSFQGQRYTTGQSNAFPRQGIYVYGESVDNTIPVQLIQGQYQLALEAGKNASGQLIINSSAQEVLSETVGPISTTYAEKGSGSSQTDYVAAMRYLQPLFQSGAVGSVRFNVVR